MWYLDSSIIVNILLAQLHPRVWNSDWPYCFSTLLPLEVRRTLHTASQQHQLTAGSLALAVDRLREIEQGGVLLGITPEVLTRASAAFPTPIKTLDAIHLATAMILRERRYPDLVFATHDRRLGLAARLGELPVVGVS